MADSTASVVIAVAKSKAEVHARSTSHMSTTTTLGDAKIIQGGGMVTFAYCRQAFRILDVLRGESEAEERALEYRIVEKAEGFPLPAPEQSIPDGAKVILLLDEMGKVLKALPDTLENRKAVRNAVPRKHAPKK